MNKWTGQILQLTFIVISFSLPSSSISERGKSSPLENLSQLGKDRRPRHDRSNSSSSSSSSSDDDGHQRKTSKKRSKSRKRKCSKDRRFVSRSSTMSRSFSFSSA